MAAIGRRVQAGVRNKGDIPLIPTHFQMRGGHRENRDLFLTIPAPRFRTNRTIVERRLRSIADVREKRGYFSFVPTRAGRWIQWAWQWFSKRCARRTSRSFMSENGRESFVQERDCRSYRF